VALLTALALLLLFSVLGMVYIRYMELENESTDFDLRVVRARYAAVSGVQASIAEIQAAVQGGQSPALEWAYDFPVYGRDLEAEAGFGIKETRRAAALVTVTDESGAINLNHAPAPVLAALLGVSAAAAEKIVEARPQPSPSDDLWLEGGMSTWFISLEDLVARGLIDAESAAAIDPSLVTFCSVADHGAPGAYWNVNAAPAGSIQAALGVTADVAAAVLAARPIQSAEQLAAAAGKTPDQFPLPAESIAYASRCFRVVGKGRYANVFSDGREYRISRARIEAIVVLDDEGVPSIRQWRESSGWDESEDEEQES